MPDKLFTDLSIPRPVKGPRELRLVKDTGAIGANCRAINGSCFGKNWGRAGGLSSRSGFFAGSNPDLRPESRFCCHH